MAKREHAAWHIANRKAATTAAPVARPAAAAAPLNTIYVYEAADGEHYVDDLESIPEKYRKKARELSP